MMSGLRRAAVSDDRHRSTRADLELDAAISLEVGAVRGDGDREVAALAHQRARSAACASRRSAVVAEPRSEVELDADRPPPSGELADEQVPGRNRPSTSATRLSASSSSPPSTLQVVIRVAVSGR